MSMQLCVKGEMWDYLKKEKKRKELFTLFRHYFLDPRGKSFADTLWRLQHFGKMTG